MVGEDCLGVCKKCHGPIFAKSRWHVLRDEMAYDLWMALPSSLACSQFGYWILGYGGAHAYTCTCPEKVFDRNGGNNA